MGEFVVSIFRLECQRGYPPPHLNTGFRERESGDEWNVICGGSRAYVARSSNALDKDFAEQSDDSHFVVRRLTATLLLGGVGLFQAKAMGRIILWNIEQQQFPWTVHLDLVDPDAPDSSEQIKAMEDWWAALTQHTVLRRAAEDLHLAVSQPAEALIFVYRGLEWIVKGLGISWEDLAKNIGVPFSNIRDLKQLANDETGVRHGSTTGEKLRAVPENYATWPCALLDALNVARQKLEPAYKPMTSKEAGQVLAKGSKRRTVRVTGPPPHLDASRLILPVAALNTFGSNSHDRPRRRAAHRFLSAATMACTSVSLKARQPRAECAASLSYESGWNLRPRAEHTAAYRMRQNARNSSPSN